MEPTESKESSLTPIPAWGLKPLSIVLVWVVFKLMFIEQEFKKFQDRERCQTYKVEKYYKENL